MAKYDVKVEQTSANNSTELEDELKNKLNDGYVYLDNVQIGNKVYLIFQKQIAL